MDAPSPFPSRTPQEQFAAALDSHRAGRLEEAERGYRHILKGRHDHLPSLHLLGDILRRQGRMAEAGRSFLGAVLLQPELADGWNAFALALHAAGRTGDAVTALRRGIALAPGSAPAHNNLGLMRGEDGGLSFRHAILCDPGMAEAYANLGTLRGGRNDLRRALALRPDSAAGWYALAGGVAESGAESGAEEAQAACRAALVCQPDYGRAHNLIGLMLVQQGDLAGAARRYRWALACEPDPAFYANLADLGPVEEGDLAAMEALDGEASIPLHFALGKAYDDRGEGERAFHHYLRGNALKRRTLAYDEAAALAAMAKAERFFSAERLGRLGGQGDPGEEPVFILGMPRSGSTLIEQILASHACVHGGDERPDFPELLGGFDGEDFRALGAAYLARSRALAPGALRITDKLPGNFLHAGAIHLALPNARIIHSRRDPADTCLSCFTKLFRGEQAYTYDLGELGRYYRAYDRLMAHWRSVLPASIFIEVDYEALVADPEAQTRRLLAHCGLAWDPACLDFHRTRRAVRTASAAQVRRPIYRNSIGRWRLYGDLLAPLLTELEAA